MAADSEDSLFPSFDTELEEVVLDDDLEEDIEQFVADAFGYTWTFDFDTGDLKLSNQGKASVQEGVDAVRQWCQHILRVRVGETPIFDEDVGVDIEALLGGKADDAYVNARITQEIERALVLHDRINAVVVDDIVAVQGNAFVFVTITLDTGDVIEDAIGLGA